MSAAQLHVTRGRLSATRDPGEAKLFHPAADVAISVIVPAKNEANNLPILIERLLSVLGGQRSRSRSSSSIMGVQTRRSRCCGRWSVCIPNCG